jgi:DMSO/TMAO reductase YedYZ molybdopterin-dependent catalytic subunit
VGILVISRRRFLLSSAVSWAGLALAGCDRLTESRSFQSTLSAAELLSLRGQRLLIGGQSLAREYSARELSSEFPANGTTAPQDESYQTLAADGFRTWRLIVDGRVDHPATYSLADLRSLPSRTQITRTDCVEGWSAIAQWTGVPLRLLLLASGLKQESRYVVFHCADTLEGTPMKGGDERHGRYYESIDLIDAFHPQTILAYSMNGRALSIAHGAPLRLRLERQLGYKHAKYVMRIEVAERLDHVGGGKGGFWEDRGYEWYAGI